jgi:tetratricopeptide (TPR) repeat protein
MMAGRAADAEAELRRDHGTLAAMGEQNYIALVTCLLAEAVRQQGRLAEAADLAGEAEAMTAEDDVGAQCGWRAVRARVLCAVGDHETALSLAEEALALQMDSDEPAARAEALLDRGLARLGLGDPRRASQDAAAALDLYTAKGHRPGMVRASAVLTDAGGASGR